MGARDCVLSRVLGVNCNGRRLCDRLGEPHRPAPWGGWVCGIWDAVQEAEHGGPECACGGLAS